MFSKSGIREKIKRIDQFISDTSGFVRASWLSILFIAIIVLLISFMDQGPILFVGLIKSPLNLILFVFYTFYFALILSHYPVYLEMRNRLEDIVEWKLDYGFLDLFGIVTYKEKRNPEDTSMTIAVFRKSLGVILLLSVFYMMLASLRKLVYMDANWTGIILTLILVYLFYRFQVWLSTKVRERHENRVSYKRVNILANASYACTGVGFIVLVICSALYDWHFVTILTFLIFYLLLTLSFAFFRALRSSYSVHKYGIRSIVGDHAKFLLIISVLGWANVIFIVFLHFIGYSINPLNCLLAYFIFFYGCLIIPIKTHYYHSWKFDKSESLNPFWLRAIVNRTASLFFIGILTISIITGFIGNKLHLLPTVKDDKSLVDYDLYCSRLSAYIDGSESKDLYFIASYGGGLKANIWSQLVLMELEKRLPNMIALSGVSGGSLGQAFYVANFDNSIKQRQASLDEMATTNFVTPDLTYLLGYDFLREMNFFWKDFGPDRAMLAMQKYASILDMQSLNEKSFKSFWSQNFRKRLANGYITPVIISNATGTHQRRGVATSLDWTEDEFSRTFFDAEQISESRNGQSINYVNTISCANRFPVFSPAARIAGKGHFLDGGYFENSGMLSLVDFYKRLKRDVNDLSNCRIHFIQISNGRDLFIEHHLGYNGLNKVETETGELMAIGATLASTEMLPRYLKRKYKLTKEDNVTFSNIHMPYRLTEDDVLSYFNASEVDVNGPDGLMRFVSDVNDEIYEALDKYRQNHSGRIHCLEYGFIDPPLSRYMTQESLDYMKAIIENYDSLFIEVDRKTGPYGD